MEVLARYDDILGIDWVAALYESYSADSESNADENDYSAGHYAVTAHRLCEELESYAWEHMCQYCHTLTEDMDNHIQYCEPMDASWHYDY
jgi:hypothetical protein